MAQLSPSTSVFDQVATSIGNLLDKIRAGKYVAKEEILEDLNKIMSDAYNNIGGMTTKIDFIAQGEPPSSQKMNKFFSTLKNDINISAKQLDYLLAKTISVFNLFTSEIENEKKYSQRIFSKAKVLQMYSQSPAEDIVYIGDSFDNQDYMDFSKMSQTENPLVKNGYMTIQLRDSKKWIPSSITINPSNGIPGNNHLAIKKPGQIDSPNYAYYFKDKASSANPLNIIDANPLSIFEYECLNVDKSTYMQNLFYSENEFSYIVDNNYVKGSQSGSLFNWSNHDLKQPLILDFTMTYPSGDLANSVTITPYFGSSKSIRVTHIYVTDKTGVTQDVLTEPIYIGASSQSLNFGEYSKYFLDTATVRFQEKNAVKINVIMEQSDYTTQEILHSYWVTDYSQGSSDNSPFFGTTRFNPDILSKDIYQEIVYDKYQLIPKSSNPNEFSKQDLLSKRVSVSVRKKNSGVETYVVPIKIQSDLLSAKIMSIGIRDVTVEYVNYNDTATMVSLPYKFDNSVESLMIGIDTDIASFSKSIQLIDSYVSVDQGKKWLPINASQFGFNSANETANPEILSFNQNVPNGYKLPGIKYYNYPEVPKEIKEVLVMINLKKDRINNVVPTVYAYTLATKVRTI